MSGRLPSCVFSKNCCSQGGNPLPLNLQFFDDEQQSIMATFIPKLIACLLLMSEVIPRQSCDHDCCLAGSEAQACDGQVCCSTSECRESLPFPHCSCTGDPSTRHRGFISEQSSQSALDGAGIGINVVFQNAETPVAVQPPERLRSVGLPVYVRYCSLLC